jgi:hypothetical protein
MNNDSYIPKNPTIEDVAEYVRQAVLEYYQDEEHRRQFEQRYKEKYHKDYKWR